MSFPAVPWSPARSADSPEIVLDCSVLATIQNLPRFEQQLIRAVAADLARKRAVELGRSNDWVTLEDVQQARPLAADWVQEYFEHLASDEPFRMPLPTPEFTTRVRTREVAGPRPSL